MSERISERIVFMHLPGETEAVPAGRLTMIEQGLQVQASRFAYGRRYLQRANAVPVDPVALALADGGGDAELVPPDGLALLERFAMPPPMPGGGESSRTGSGHPPMACRNRPIWIMPARTAQVRWIYGRHRPAGRPTVRCPP